MAVPFSPETIGRHERGDVQMTPEDAVLYSERYGCQSLLLQYCADCPVGKMTGKAATERQVNRSGNTGYVLVFWCRL